MKITANPHFFWRFPNIKFRKNLFGGYRDVSAVQTDGPNAFTRRCVSMRAQLIVWGRECMSAVTTNADEKPTFLTDFPGLWLAQPSEAFQVFFLFLWRVISDNFLFHLYPVYVISAACLQGTHQNHLFCLFTYVTLQKYLNSYNLIWYWQILFLKMLKPIKFLKSWLWRFKFGTGSLQSVTQF